MIYIVGAGPGDKELITVKGMRLLENAEAVMYTGTTVDESILEYCRSSEEVVSSAGMVLDDIVSLLREWNKRYDVVVRLHSGDPVVYGAIGEEMDAFQSEGIPFEVVPGISAYSALAARVHMELTIPGVVQSILITRLPGKTPVPEDVDVLFSQQPAAAVYLSGGRGVELLRKLREYYPDNSVLVVGHKVSRKEEVVLSKRLCEWTADIEFSPNLTLFLIRKDAKDKKSRLYSGER